MAAADVKQNKASIKDFNGRVIEVHSGDSLTVEREQDQKTVRIFLSSVKAPQLGNSREGKESQGEP